uniref:Uncharacterized protein n=1 Tax=Manihot esculenta TaxID=3983 RepID=A0A2C9WHY6_MANES
MRAPIRSSLPSHTSPLLPCIFFPISDTHFLLHYSSPTPSPSMNQNEPPSPSSPSQLHFFTQHHLPNPSQLHCPPAR